jgi:hypothetical protein
MREEEFAFRKLKPGFFTGAAVVLQKIQAGFAAGSPPERPAPTSAGIHAKY